MLVVFREELVLRVEVEIGLVDVEGVVGLMDDVEGVVGLTVVVVVEVVFVDMDGVVGLVDEEEGAEYEYNVGVG